MRWETCVRVRGVWAWREIRQDLPTFGLSPMQCYVFVTLKGHNVIGL